LVFVSDLDTIRWVWRIAMVIISPTMYAPDIQGMSHIAEVVKECHIAEVVVYLR